LLVLVADDDEDVVEAGAADFTDGSADERLIAKRQNQLLGSHTRRAAGGEDNRSDHAPSLAEAAPAAHSRIDVCSHTGSPRSVTTSLTNVVEKGGSPVFPAAFDYLRAHSPDEAFAFLQQHGGDARVLAGGQSLIPAMRFRLARPAVLVDINAVR